MTPEEVLKFARDNAVEFVDLRFMDLPATGHRSGCRHVTIPLSELTLRTFQDGLEPDGLSICGQPQIEQPDLLLVPDAQTAHLDPFSQHPTLAMLCDLKDHRTRKDHAADPRAVVRRAAARLSSSGIADQCTSPRGWSSTFSTRSVTSRASTPHVIRSIHARAYGGADAMSPTTSAPNCQRAPGQGRCRPSIVSTTSEARWWRC